MISFAWGQASFGFKNGLGLSKALVRAWFDPTLFLFDSVAVVDGAPT
jgi:hypothetical protein